MNEDKQCLQRDTTEGRAGRTCLMFVVISRRRMSTSQWSQAETTVSPQPTCRHTVSLATAVCCAITFFKPSFSLCRCSTRCLQSLN